MGTKARSLFIVLVLCIGGVVRAAEVFVRVKVVETTGEQFKITTGGFRHDGRKGVWQLPSDRSVLATRGQWSEWMDLSGWELPARSDREGGIAEWPALKLTVSRVAPAGEVNGCALEVQLADKPDEQSVVLSFGEKSGSASIAFLLPHPLRQNKGEFETGTQMAVRHAAWAAEAMPTPMPALRKFDVISSVWGHYDPRLAFQESQTLQRLGFNVIGGLPVSIQRELGLRGYTATWLLEPDPDKADAKWKQGEGASIARALTQADGRWEYENMAHYVVADEISTISLAGVTPEKVNAWFREWLKARGVTDAELPRPIAEIEFPANVTTRTLKTLDRTAPLPQRRLQYFACKFGQYWSVRQLRHTSDLIKSSLPKMKTETLPTDHGFFNAWGPPTMGMSYCLLDLFEIGKQRAVDIISAEDWMGLNHMYGPKHTWTGPQSLEYLSAILRSGIESAPGSSVALRTLITPSDDDFLRLKAYSSLGQGSKSFFFWTYGPTFIGTENYWSDLQSQYSGVAKFTRALRQHEDLLFAAKPVRDRVAMLYSVSHDYWHTDDPASFVEMKLTWHALRHLHVQPDILREEDAEEGRLKDYKVLYVIGQCLTRKASAAIDQWVKDGGVVYLAGGAATRDEFYEPYVPPFAATVFPADAAEKMTKEKHTYNERTDLAVMQAMTTATLVPGGEIGVRGCRLDLLELEHAEAVPLLGRYADNKMAAQSFKYEKGWVFAVGFLPALAYSPYKFMQSTLDEVWPEGPRKIIGTPLEAAHLDVVADASVPVVETSLLAGPLGTAVVLVNYTYKPIDKLRVTLRGNFDFETVTSSEGVPVTVVSHDDKQTIVELPLKWTDILYLTPKRAS